MYTLVMNTYCVNKRDYQFLSFLFLPLSFSIFPLFHRPLSLVPPGFLFPFLSYFEKIAHMSVVWAYVSLWLCGFVAVSVRMCVAGANKVEGTISWCLGTNENLASKLDFAALKVKQGHFETAIVILHKFVIIYHS